MFEIKLCDFPATWVEQKLAALCIRHMWVWLEMPVSAGVSEIAARRVASESSVLPAEFWKAFFGPRSKVFEKHWGKLY